MTCPVCDSVFVVINPQPPQVKDFTCPVCGKRGIEPEFIVFNEPSVVDDTIISLVREIQQYYEERR